MHLNTVLIEGVRYVRADQVETAIKWLNKERKDSSDREASLRLRGADKAAEAESLTGHTLEYVLYNILKELESL